MAAPFSWRKNFTPGIAPRIVRPAQQFSRLAQCRSGSPGWTVWRCQHCQRTHWRPHGCGNRYCPSGQHQRSRQWLQEQRRALLPVRYFHWVFTKGSVVGPDVVLDYLGRYTHRVAITHGRLRSLDPSARTLSFTYKDYADASRTQTLTLTGVEFIRRLRRQLMSSSPSNRTHCPLATAAPPHSRNAHAQALSPAASTRSPRLQRGQARPSTAGQNPSARRTTPYAWRPHRGKSGSLLLLLL
jgi:hypothetical protein